MTKILILGSEGFLGSVLTPYLLKENRHFEITGVDKCFFGINNKKINLPITVFLSISIQNHTELWLKNFVKVVNQYDQIIEVHRLTGSHSDYQITILSSSIEEYDKFQQILIKEIECTNMSSHISLQTIKKNNKYPLNFI